MSESDQTKPRSLSDGDQLEPVIAPPIDITRLAYMAVAMRDPNPVHLDDSFAQQIGLPGVIAHGTFAISYLGAAITRQVGVNHLRTLNVELMAPVFIGDVLTTGVTVDAIEPAKGDEVVHATLQVANQAGTPVARGRASWVIR